MKVKFSDYDYSLIKIQKLCQETPECKGFTILTNNDVWLKHTMANRNPAEVYGEEMISGPDRCVSKYILFLTLCIRKVIFLFFKFTVVGVIIR